LSLRPTRNTITAMRHHVLLLAFILAGCPKPAPPPVTPAPTELVCGVEEADHDEAVDHVVTALQDQTLLDPWVTKYTRPVIVCVVQEIVSDTNSAPVLVGRAQAWLTAGGNQ